MGGELIVGADWGRLWGIDAGLFQMDRRRVIAWMVMAGSVVPGWAAPSAGDLGVFRAGSAAGAGGALLRVSQRGGEEAEGRLVSGLACGGDGRGRQRPAVVAGDAEKSRLIESVRYGNVDMQMPPKTRLPEASVAALEKWVTMAGPRGRRRRAGTVKRKGFDLEGRRSEHWCWHGPQERVVPEVARKDWPLGEIDRFVLAKLEEAGLPPAEDADRRTCIRRVTFDLTGLPPTPDEVAKFLADSSPGAHAAVVDGGWRRRSSVWNGRGTGWT